jgi:hypothetical protein
MPLMEENRLEGILIAPGSTSTRIKQLRKSLWGHLQHACLQLGHKIRRRMNPTGWALIQARLERVLVNLRNKVRVVVPNGQCSNLGEHIKQQVAISIS